MDDLRPWPDAIAGAILGGAVGDSIGLPYEGLSPRRAARLFGPPDRQRFLFGHGMVSDDTEQACLTAAAFCESPRDPAAFAVALGRRVRWWAAGLPVGAGRATVRASVRLWFGVSAANSGVFSAGNGPAMRSAVLGAAIDDLDLLRKFVRVSARLTHTDPKAFLGSLAVAVAAWCSRRSLTSPADLRTNWRQAVGAESTIEFEDLLDRVESASGTGIPVRDFALDFGGRHGVSGYIYHTVPVALLIWLRHPRDCRTAVVHAVECGGDADTLAAIVGGIIGAGVGAEQVPSDWLDRLWEWPRGVSWMRRLAEATARAAATGQATAVPQVVPVVGLVRNAIFFAAVMVHVVRRLLPPY